MPKQYLKFAICVEQLGFCKSKSDVNVCNSKNHIWFGWESHIIWRYARTKYQQVAPKCLGYVKNCICFKSYVLQIWKCFLDFNRIHMIIGDIDVTFLWKDTLSHWLLIIDCCHIVCCALWTSVISFLLILLTLCKLLDPKKNCKL